MANRYANLVGSNKIKDEYQKINIGFDKVEQEMDEKPDNSFAKINDVEAEGEDAVTIEAGTGITITTTPEEKKIRITATGEATPGPHGSEHNHDGADPIPDLVQLRSLGLGIDVDPRLSSDLNNEISVGWVRFGTGETLNRPSDEIPDFPPYGVVRVDRRRADRLAQTAYGVSGTTDVRIAVRVLGSTGWGNWVEMWHSGNVESGSNANGWYIRFPDGTQICWRKIEVDTSITDTQIFAFPASFSVDREYIAVGYGLHFHTSEQIDAWHEGKGVVSSTEFSWSARFRSDQSSITPVVELRVIAIGRWK